MSVGQRIEELRKLHNYSQNQLAKLMDVSRQAVSKWETGQNVPDSVHLIHLADVLDTDIEYLSTGRRSFARRPPVVINTVETLETVVEKPVVQVVEKIIEKIVEKPVIQYVEKPVIKKIYRREFVRNPLEFIILGGICLVIGVLIGILIG